jgi:putative ABC transport system permease protein
VRLLRQLRRGTLLLTLITLAAALFAVGVPGLIESSQTSSLQQTLNAASPIQHSLLATQTYTPAAPAMTAAAAADGNGTPDLTVLQQKLSQLEPGAPAIAAPDPAHAWEFQVSAKSAFDESMPDGIPSRGALDVRPDLADDVRVVSGTLPMDYAYTPRAPHTPARLTADVALTAAVAKIFDAHVGSQLGWNFAGETIDLDVTAIVAPLEPDATYWSLDTYALTPDLDTPANAAPYWVLSALLGPTEQHVLDLLVNGGNPVGATTYWDIPVDTAGYTAAQTGALVTALTGYQDGSVPAAVGVTMQSEPLGFLNPFQTSRQVVDSILSIVLAGVVVLGAVTLLMAARLTADRRRSEYALLRARGQSLLQLAARATVTQSLPAAVGLMLAFAVVRLALPASSWTGTSTLLFACVAVVCLTSPGLVAVLEHRRIAVGTARRDVAGTRRSPRRRVIEAVLLLVALGAVVTLRSQGLGSGQDNLLGAAVPTLIAAIATVLAVRLYPLLLRPVARAASRSSGATGFLGMTGAVRAGSALILPVFIMTLTLTLAALGGLIYTTVGAGRTQASWTQVGADADFQINAQDPASAGTVPSGWLRQIAKIHGVTDETVISQQSVTQGTPQYPAVIYSIDPQSYAAVSADTPWPLNASLLADGGSTAAPVPAVVAASSGLRVGQVFTLEPMYASPIRVRVVASESSTAASPSGDFVLLPDWATTADAQGWEPSDVLISGADLDERALNALVQKLAPGSAVTYQAQAVSQLENAPLEHLAQDGYLLSILAAGCFGVCTILISLALTAAARNHRLLLLRTLGLTPRQERGIAWAETSPLAVSAALGGLAAAAALPAAIGGSLNLTAFTGLGAATGLRFDVAVPLLAAALGVVVVAATVALQSTVARRRTAAVQLRIGDEA